MTDIIFDGSQEPLEMRQTFTDLMDRLMERESRVVLGDADVGFSVYGDKLAYLHQKYGDRFFDVGIQEANLAGVGAGLSLTGKIPYLVTFAPFMTRRAYDALFVSLAYARLGAKLIGTDPGYTSAYNGGSHSALEDTGIMRCIPGITIIDITDSEMLRWAVNDLSRPESLYYIRMPRSMKVKKVYGPNASFAPGRANVLREGGDVTLLASGLMAARALEAAALLEKRGVSARVADVVTVKPVDAEFIRLCAEETGAIVCCDNHRATGGLCSAVAEVLADAGAGCAFGKAAIPERFGEVGAADALAALYGLEPEDIAARAMEAIERRKRT